MDSKSVAAIVLTYVCAAILSSAANVPIRALLIRQFGDNSVRYKELFDLTESAAIIGVIERFIYIFAIFVQQFVLISGWILMKSFAKWLEKNEEESDSLKIYNHYIIGNGISLITALLLGEAALLARPFAEVFIAWISRGCAPLG